MLLQNQTHLAYTLNLFQHVASNDPIAKVILKIDLSPDYKLCLHFYSEDPLDRKALFYPQDTLRS